MNQTKEIHKYCSFLDIGDGSILELVGDTNTAMFVKHNVLEDQDEILDEYIHYGVTYHPPKGELTNNGTILLPTEPKYGVEIPEIVEEIDSFIYRYLDISDSYRKIACYYVLLTWVYDCFEVIPYLRALGDYGSGKSRFQKTIGSICYRPMFVAGATTPSPIFRIIDMYRGTLVIDEADFRYSDASTEIIKILNCGYSMGTPVLRTEGDAKDRTPTSYIVYGPKIIGTRKRFDDSALESRCFTEIMSGRPRKDIPIHLPKEFYKEALELRNILLGFRLQHYGQLEIDLKHVIPGIEPRINQIMLPIMSIASNEETRDEIRVYIQEYAKSLTSQRSDEIPAQVLRIMTTMIQEGERLFVKEISVRINKDRNREQGENPISPTAIGKINSALFAFQTRKVNGKSEILWSAEKASQLCERYGIAEQPLVDVVEVVEVHQELPAMLENSLEAESPLLVTPETTAT